MRGAARRRELGPPREVQHAGEPPRRLELIAAFLPVGDLEVDVLHHAPEVAHVLLEPVDTLERDEGIGKLAVRIVSGEIPFAADEVGLVVVLLQQGDDLLALERTPVLGHRLRHRRGGCRRARRLVLGRPDDFAHSLRAVPDRLESGSDILRLFFGSDDHGSTACRPRAGPEGHGPDTGAGCDGEARRHRVSI